MSKRIMIRENFNQQRSQKTVSFKAQGVNYKKNVLELCSNTFNLTQITIKMILILFTLTFFSVKALADKNGNLAQPSDVPVVEIAFDPRVVHNVNGQDSIPEDIFGINAYCMRTICQSPKMVKLLKAANIPVIFISGFAKAAIPPKKPTSVASVYKWYDSPEALASCVGPGWDSGIKAMRKCGIEPAMALFRGPADWMCDKNNMPINPELYAACVAGYAKLIKEKLSPEFRYLSIMGEANCHWWKSGLKVQEVIDIYNKAAKAVKLKVPGVEMGGFADCWPPAWPPVQRGLNEWYGWELITMPKIKKCGNLLDYFDFHAYEQEPEVLLEEAQAVVNAMHNENGGYRKVMISEWGYCLDDHDSKSDKARWEKRAFRCANSLIGVMKAPSYVQGMSLHEAGKFQNWGIFKSSLIEDQYPTYWAYWMFRNLRGKIIFLPNPDKSLKVIASRKDGMVSLVVLNSGTKSREIKVKMAEDVVLARGSWDLLYFDETKKKLSRTSGLGLNLLCPPKSLASFQLAATSPIPYGRVVKDELIFGDSLHKRFNKGPNDDGSYGVGQSVKINFQVSPEKLRDASQAFIRIGMLSARKGDKIELKIGSDRYKLNSAWYQTIPLKNMLKAGKNTAKFTLLKRGYPEKKPHILRISSAVLVIRKGKK